MNVTEAINGAMDHVRAIYFCSGFVAASLILLIGTIAWIGDGSFKVALKFYGIALVIIAIQVLLFVTRHIPSSQL